MSGESTAVSFRLRWGYVLLKSKIYSSRVGIIMVLVLVLVLALVLVTVQNLLLWPEAVAMSESVAMRILATQRHLPPRAVLHGGPPRGVLHGSPPKGSSCTRVRQCMDRCSTVAMRACGGHLRDMTR